MRADDGRRDAVAGGPTRGDGGGRRVHLLQALSSASMTASVRLVEFLRGGARFALLRLRMRGVPPVSSPPLRATTA